MSDSNVVWVDFGKRDEFFDPDRPVYSIKISVQAPAWWARLRRSPRSVTETLPEEQKPL
jgi:hypothetical protein